MLAQFDRFSIPSSCACCGGAPALHSTSVPLPVEDLCCTACGRAIYRGFAANEGSVS
jgi:hypothetical protein